MEGKNFSMGEAVGFGWDKVKSNLGFFAVLALIYIAYAVLNSFIQKIDDRALSGVLTIASYVVSMIAGIGYLKILLKLTDGEKPEYEDLWSHASLFWRYLGGSILFILIVMLGTVLLVVPGIIWAIKYGFVPYLIVDKGMRPVEALKASAVITEGARWQLFLFGFVLLGVEILGFLALGVGIFLAIPVMYLASIYVYRQLSKEPEQGGDIPAPEPEAA
ncbi:MAG: DUF975 family protein [bacterium]|nr:DUF975 family protein [bacterium]